MNLRTLTSLLLVALTLMLGACDSPEQASTQNEAADPVEQVITDTETTTETNTDNLTDTADLASVEESVEESIDDEADNGSDSVELSPATTSVESEEVNWQYQEGVHFRRMTTSQGTSSAPDKIEVAEIFWYGCSHCYDIEPIIAQWKTQLPADVSVVKIPVIWNPTNQIHGRIMYTAEALGVFDDVHPIVFEAIHQRGLRLTTDEEIVALFNEAGVEEATFREAYGSFGVTSALKRAENLTRRYDIRSTPTIVVNGKYVVQLNGETVSTHGQMLDVARELTERERRNR